jgi:hypothetical protein
MCALSVIKKVPKGCKQLSMYESVKTHVQGNTLVKLYFTHKGIIRGKQEMKQFILGSMSLSQIHFYTCVNTWTLQKLLILL